MKDKNSRNVVGVYPANVSLEIGQMARQLSPFAALGKYQTLECRKFLIR
jgi:hypothetical protein